MKVDDVEWRFRIGFFIDFFIETSNPQYHIFQVCTSWPCVFSSLENIRIMLFWCNMTLKAKNKKFDKKRYYYVGSLLCCKRFYEQLFINASYSILVSLQINEIGSMLNSHCYYIIFFKKRIVFNFHRLSIFLIMYHVWKFRPSSL